MRRRYTILVSEQRDIRIYTRIVVMYYSEEKKLFFSRNSSIQEIMSIPEVEGIKLEVHMKIKDMHKMDFYYSYKDNKLTCNNNIDLVVHVMDTTMIDPERNSDDPRRDDPNCCVIDDEEPAQDATANDD